MLAKATLSRDARRTLLDLARDFEERVAELEAEQRTQGSP